MHSDDIVVRDDLAGDSKLGPVARAMIALDRAAVRRGGSAFYAEVRLIAELTGVPRQTAHRHLRALRALGYLSLVKAGIPGRKATGKANTWAWHDPPRPGETVWNGAG